MKKRNAIIALILVFTILVSQISLQFIGASAATMADDFTREAGMMSSYVYTVSPDLNAGKAELAADEGYQWSVGEYWGNFWHVWDGNSANGSSNTKGSVIFESDNFIDSFRIRFHILSNNISRLDGIKVYASSDKENWTEIAYNTTQLAANAERYSAYIYAAFATDTEIKYIKVEMNPNQSSWHGVDPGIYSFEYNEITGVNLESPMANSYSATISPDINSEFATFLPDAGYQWSVSAYNGNFWHVWDGNSANGSSYTKGSIVFASARPIYDFRIKFHILSNSIARLNGIKLYASEDNNNWVRIPYNTTQPVANIERYSAQIYADFDETVNYRYIKVEMNPSMSFWHGVDPAIYSFQYNYSPITVDGDMAEIYSRRILPDDSETVLTATDGYEWDKYTYDAGAGDFWCVWDGDNDTVTPGTAEFNVGETIDKFRIKVYIDNVDRINNSISLLASEDGINWITVDYNISELSKPSSYYTGYLYADFSGDANIKYIKFSISANNNSWHGIFPGLFYLEYVPQGIAQAESYTYLHYPSEAITYAEDGYHWYYMPGSGSDIASYTVGAKELNSDNMTYLKGYAIFESYDAITNYRITTVDASKIGDFSRNITLYASADGVNWEEIKYYVAHNGKINWDTQYEKISLYGKLNAELGYRFIKIVMPYETQSWKGIFPSLYSFEYSTDTKAAELKPNYAYNLAPSKGTPSVDGWTRTGDKASFGGKEYYSYWFGSENDYNKSGEVIFTDPKGGKITDFNITVGEILNCNDYDGSGQQEGSLNGRILFYASSDGENWKKVDHSRKENKTYNLNNVVYPIYDCYGSFDETDQITYIKLVFKGNEYSVCKWYKIASLFRVQFNSTSALSGEEIFLDESKEDINKIYGFVDDKTKYSYTVTPLEANAHAESDSEWYYFTGDVNGTAVYAVKEKKLASDGMTFTKGSLGYSSFNHFTAFSLGVVDISPKADTVKTLTVYASEDGKNWVKVPYKVEYVGNFWNSAERYEYNIYGTLGKNSKYHYIRVVTDYANKSWKGIFPGILDFSYNTDGSAASLKKNYDITLFGNQGEAVATNGGELKSLLSVKYDDEYTYPNYYFGKDKDNATYEGYITYSDLSGGYILDYNINLSLRDHGCSWATGTISKTPAGLLNGRIKILVSTNGQDWFNAEYTAKLLREEKLGDNKNIIFNNYNCFGSFKESDKIKFIRLIFVNNKESNEKYYPVPAVSRVQMNTTKKFETPTLEKYDYIYYPYDAVSGVYDDVSKWSFYNSEYHDDGVWKVCGKLDKNGFSNTKGYVIFRNNDVYTGFYLRVFDLERNANHVQQIKILASADGKKWDNINYVLSDPTKVMAHYNQWGNFWQFGIRGVLDVSKKYTQIRVEMPKDNRTWYGIAPAIYDLRYNSTRKPSEKTTYDYTYTGESEYLEAKATDGGEWKISDITEIDGVKYGGYWFGRTEKYDAYEGIVTYTPETGEAITDFNITLGIMRNCGYMHPGESRTLGPLNGYIRLEASKDGKNWFNISYSDKLVKQFISGGVKYDIFDCFGSFDRNEGVKQIRLVWMSNKQVFNMYYNTPNVFRVQMNAPRIPESIYPYDSNKAREEEKKVNLNTAITDSSNVTIDDGVLTLSDPSSEGWFIIKGNKISWFIARISKKASTNVTAYRADSMSGEWTQLDLKSFSKYIYMKEKLAIDDRFDYLKIVITPSATDTTFAVNELIVHSEKVINFLPKPFGEQDGSILLIDPMDNYDIATDVFEMENKTITYGIYNKKATIMKRMYIDGDAELRYTVPNNAQGLYIREWRKIDNSIDTYALTILVSSDGETWQELYVEDMEVNEEVHADTNDMLVSYQTLNLEDGIKYVKLQAPWLDNSTDGYGIDEVRILYSATPTGVQANVLTIIFTIIICVAGALMLAGLVIFIIVAKKKQILFFKAKAK